MVKSTVFGIRQSQVHFLTLINQFWDPINPVFLFVKRGDNDIDPYNVF